jgi:acylpyruvate hydrolase
MMGIAMGNIFCIGRNYSEHARELGNPVPATPVVFLKASGSLVRPLLGRWHLPRELGRIDPEIEWVVEIGRDATSLKEADALAVVSGYAVGLDVTARDLQSEAKSKGLPWLASKGRKGFAPLSEIKPVTAMGHGPFELELHVNGKVRQRASTAEMIFSLPRILCFLAELYGLTKGDLIFTGTPAGVGPVEVGDRVAAFLRGKSGLIELALQVE